MPAVRGDVIVSSRNRCGMGSIQGEIQQDIQYLDGRQIQVSSVHRKPTAGLCSQYGSRQGTLHILAKNQQTSKEFNDIFAGLKIKPRHFKKENKLKLKYQTKLRYNLTDLPEAVDWRDKDCVTRVKDQGNCSSCYAFAATGALEGLYCKETGKLESLSEQNILDCTLNFGNDGCVTGNPENAFKYVDSKGIDTETSYPYTGAIGECKILAGVLGMWPNGYTPVYPHGLELKLQKAVAERPVSVCIDTKGEGDKFKSYGQGVYDNSECGENEEDLTHAMLAVGYDTTEDGVDYWIIKNSYGADWGIDGYLWMIRNDDNRCGIATRASYPTEWKNKFVTNNPTLP